MLLSPGHSPRHLSSPSPSPSLVSADPPSSSSSSLPKTKRDPVVLDEDTYVAAIEKIIERDFFPDIPKLRDRLDWLQAVRTGDPVQIRDAQLKIMDRRRGSNPTSSSHGNIASTTTTTFPRNSITPFDFEPTPGMIEGNSDGQGGKVLEGDGVDDLSLDQFFRKFTSEDNDSFNKIMDKVNRKRKERYGYLLKGEKEEEVKEDVKRDRITDGFGTSGQPTSTLEGWKYEAKNLLMYHPADRGEAPLTEEEMALRLKGLTKEIDRYNTRFHGKMLDNSRPNEEEVEVLYSTVAGATPVMAERDRDKTKKYDLEDLRKTPINRFYVESEKKAENGYSFVKTPSPAPGVDESPFVTWGEIEGTPLRLEPEDTPVDIGGSADQPCFKIPCPPSRDLKAHSLSREAARKLKERSKMFHRPPLPLPLPSPMRGASASPNVRTLSPAAQKFMRNAMSKSSGSVDESLRASYRGNSPAVASPSNSGRSMSRLAGDWSIRSRSPSIREGSNPPW